MANMKKLNSGLLYSGSEDEMIPRNSIDRLAAAVPALTLKVAEGKPHDFLNLNDDGNTTRWGLSPYVPFTNPESLTPTLSP